jgi:hypothetical protein
MLLVLSARASACLESICSPAPGLWSGAGKLLQASRHVRLIGEAKLSRNVCEWSLGVLDRPPGMSRSGARPKGFW